MKSVAVVGSDGALGKLLTRKLGACGVPLRSPQFTNVGRVSELAPHDVVVHTAGPRVRPGLGWSDYLREHIGTTRRVAWSMRPGAHLIHFSSASVYGAQRDNAGAQTPESPDTFPAEAYAWAKLTAEAVAQEACRERGVRLTIVRPSIVYGPEVGGVFSSMAKLARKGIRLVLVPDRTRHHLLHTEVLLAMVQRLIALDVAPDRLVLADPFHVTSGHVNRLMREAAPRAMPMPATFELVATLLRHWQRRLEFHPPTAASAAAMLALDNTYDWQTAFGALQLDQTEFPCERCFDAFLRG